MIKLTLPPKPTKLTEQEDALTREFIASGKEKTVWRKDYIVDPLLEMTSHKCAYSEVKLNEEGKYMEVEHFKHKNLYPNDVVRWGNLLPSCKECNVSKGTHDVVNSPIINPIIDKPQDHLSIHYGHFSHKDEKGHNTIEVLDLNNTDIFKVPRFREANYVIDALSKAFLSLKEADSQRKKEKSIREIKMIFLKCGQPDATYSASTATYILYDWSEFSELKAYLNKNGYWDEVFDELINRLNTIALP